MERDPIFKYPGGKWPLEELRSLYAEDFLLLDIEFPDKSDWQTLTQFQRAEKKLWYEKMVEIYSLFQRLYDNPGLDLGEAIVSSTILDRLIDRGLLEVRERNG